MCVFEAVCVLLILHHNCWCVHNSFIAQFYALHFMLFNQYSNLVIL